MQDFRQDFRLFRRLKKDPLETASWALSMLLKVLCVLSFGFCFRDRCWAKLLLLEIHSRRPSFSAVEVAEGEAAFTG